VSQWALVVEGRAAVAVGVQFQPVDRVDARRDHAEVFARAALGPRRLEALPGGSGDR
jgi:hypothetical protein